MNQEIAYINVYPSGPSCINHNSIEEAFVADSALRTKYPEYPQLTAIIRAPLVWTAGENLN